MFQNYLSRKMEADAVKEEHGRWYIKMGFAGFNSPANNRLGYKSKRAAEAAILRYQSKG